MSEQTNRPATVRDLKRLLESLPDDMPLVNYESYWSEEVELAGVDDLPRVLRVVDVFYRSEQSKRLYLYTAEYARSRDQNAITISNERDALRI